MRTGKVGRFCRDEPVLNCLNADVVPSNWDSLKRFDQVALALLGRLELRIRQPSMILFATFW